MWGLVGDLYSSIVPRGGTLYDSTLQKSPPLPDLGRWGLTLIGALQPLNIYLEIGRCMDGEVYSIFGIHEESLL